MRVGVTGGNGFIGGWVCDELARRGHIPVIFDHRSRPSTHEQFLGNVCDETALVALAGQVDGIIHLAAVLGTQETIARPKDAVITNVVGGLNFLAALARYDLPGVNICVGNHWAQNPYSISKTTVERLCRMYQTEHGTRINQVRVVNAYGPRQAAPAPYGHSKVRKIVPTFICQALSGRPVEVYGDGSQVSDCIWVGHVAEALVSALEHAADGDVFAEVVEVGPVYHHEVGTIATMVHDVVGDFTPITLLPMRPGETVGRPVTADVETLKLVGMDATQFKPLFQGILETVDWFRTVEGTWWHQC